MWGLVDAAVKGPYAFLKDATMPSGSLLAEGNASTAQQGPQPVTLVSLAEYNLEAIVENMEKAMDSLTNLLMDLFDVDNLYSSLSSQKSRVR